jgi:AcrR family transcriptional regulator
MLASVPATKLVPKRLPRSVRERQMLDAAVIEFARQGFHAASMDDIAARANVSKPMVYAYLGTKEDLFVACLHREGTRVMEAIAHVVEPHLGPDEQLWRGMRAFFGYVAAHRDGWSVLYRQARGPFSDESDRMRARMIDVVTGMLTRAVEARGRRTRPADLTSLAFALVGACESLAGWMLDHDAESPDLIASRLMNIVWLGTGHMLDGATWQPPAA